MNYWIKRLILLPPSLLMASLAIFFAMRVLPGDVAQTILGSADATSATSQRLLQSYREALGLADPLWLQYVRWLWSLVNGEFGGTGIIQRDPISSIVMRRFPVTLELALLALALSWSISIPMGVVAAFFHNRWPDYLVRVLTICGHAVPSFWAALLVILGLSLIFRWAVPLTYAELWKDPGANLQKMIWPAVILSWSSSSLLARVTRSSLLEVLRSDYVRTARAKGLGERAVAVQHALRNALLPVITIGALQISTLLSGTVILETIFGIPGMGQAIVNAAINRDYPVIQSMAMLLVLFVLVMNIVVDGVYRIVDPRLSLSGDQA